MTPGQLDAYVSRLERALRQRGLEDARIVEEAREHLVDAVDEGLQRGLSIEDAEQEAFERFGAPDVVAAHAVLERGLQMNRFAAVLATVWHHKWWILVPTILTAVLTSAMSYYLLPLRYRSEALIGIVPPSPAAQYVRTADTDRARGRFQHLRQMVLSRTRLEKMISDFGLYQLEQKRAPLVEIVQQMRRDIDLTFIASDHVQNGGIDVSFVSSDPEMAVKVTERLAAQCHHGKHGGCSVQAEATKQFIGSQIDDVRKRLIAYENTLGGLRAKNGRQPLSQADPPPVRSPPGEIQVAPRCGRRSQDVSEHAASHDRRAVQHCRRRTKARTAGWPQPFSRQCRRRVRGAWPGTGSGHGRR